MSRRTATRDPLTARRRRRRAAAQSLHNVERLEERRVMAVSPLAELVATRSEVAAPSGRAVVVIDAAVEGGESLAGSFGDAAATVLVRPGDDLFASVGGALERLGDVSAIHLVTHGSSGRFSLGGTVFDAASIDEWDDGLVAWNRMAGPGADLYLWGCDVAGGDGASLIDSIHQVSGFGVAASVDLTGPARLGGDFDLEYVLGDVANPRLAAGVDVLWETVLSDYSFTATDPKQAVQAAFDALGDTIAPAIKTALQNRTGSSTVDPVAQRSISDLFGAASSISPADLESLLSLKTTVSAYLAGSSPTLSGLASAINSALATKAAAAGAVSPAIVVTPSVVRNGSNQVTRIDLAVSVSATGTAWTTVDQGTEAAPTPWGHAIQAMNTDFNATFRTAPEVRSGSRLSTGFTVSVDLTDPNAPVPSIAIASTTLEAGVFDFGPALRFGILDATIGGGESLPYVTNLSFSGGSTRTVADWSSVGASASALSGTPSATVDLPITATLGGVSVAPGATFRVAFTDLLGITPPTVTGLSLGSLPWFGNITSDDLIGAVKSVGGAYATLGTTESLAASIPFVERRALTDIFDFADLFDAAIGDVIDVTVTKTVSTGSGTQEILTRPDNLQTLADFQSYPAFAGLGITPVYDPTAGTVSIQFAASRTTPLTVAPTAAFNLAPLGALTFTGGTSPALSPTVSLGFGVEFAIGPGGPIVIGLGAEPAKNFQLSDDAVLTVTPVGGTPTTVTVTKASTSTNTSLADLVADVNAVLGGTSLEARASEFGAGIELYTPTVNASMPFGITVAATRNQAAFDLGFTDGIELTADTKGTPITIFGRPSGVSSQVVPHADTTKKFAESSVSWSLADLSGTVAYGINTIAFGDTAGAVAGAFSATLAAATSADAISLDPVATLSPQLTGSASLSLTNLSRVGGTNDIAAGATIAIAVADFTADRIDSFVPFGSLLSVSGLEDSGRGTGRLSADAAVRFSIGSETFEVTVTQAAAADNTSFADLVADFNATLSAARIVVNGTTTGTTRNLSGECSFIGSGGRVSVLHTVGSASYPVLDALLVPNLAAGGTTTGRLAASSTLTVVRGQDTYTVTVAPADTAANASFADLAADFTAALATAQKTTGGTTTTVDARDLLSFSASGSRIQPLVVQEVANPNYATVTLPPVADLGEVGYQAGLSVSTIASALTQASRVFDVLERDLAAYSSQELPLLNQSLANLLALDTGLAGRIQAFGRLSASTPQELERALETSLGVPSNDLRITYDSARKAYRIDVAYRTSVATTMAFDVDLTAAYDMLGRVMPRGIDAITDGESKAPLSVVASGTTVLSVGYDLATNQTFLYGHDGTSSRGLTNGTSFSIAFSVNGQDLQLPAKSGLDVRNGQARIQNGSLVVTLSGPSGTPTSSLYYVQPTGGQRNALDVANYTAVFGGAVTVKMPIFENFAPATSTADSIAEAQGSGVFPFIQDHPATFYLGIPQLGSYLDAVARREQAQRAIAGLLASSQSTDAQGVTLEQWRAALNQAAADLQGELYAFAPELENARNVLGAEETLLDFIRDPGMILDKLNAAIGGVESALKGLDKIPLPFVEGKLGGAVNSILGFRTGWLLDMRNKMRGAGEGVFDVMREAVFEYLGPKNANILLTYDPLGLDRSLDSMTAATRPEDIGVTFYDKKRNVLATDVRGADAFEIVFRLGQKVFDTGIDLGFQLDALAPFVEAKFDGGLRLQVGWEMVLGFGFSITDGFYLKVDGTQPEAQVRFDATLTGASKNYTQQWDVGGGYWKIVDTKGTAVTTDDVAVIDPTTNQPFRARAVNKFGVDVTGFVPTAPTPDTDPCDCGAPPAATSTGDKVWWVVGTRTGNGDYVPAELNDQGLYVPQANAYPHTLVEVTAMAPAQLAGSLFFLRLAATDKPRLGLSGFTDVDSEYFFDASGGPQNTAQERDDPNIGVNRNNEVPTRFSASVGLNMVDPSTRSNKYSVRTDATAPAGPGTKRVVDDKGQDVAGNSGAIYKPGTLGWLAGGSVDREIQGVFAKEYYDLRLKIAPPAKYEPLDIPVRVATGANIALSGMGIIDGVQLKVGDRVLVKNQAIASQNGIYTVSPGAWSRSFDANDNLDFVGKPLFVMVSEGRSNKDTGWNLLESTGTVTLGTTSLLFERTMVAVLEPVAGIPVTRLKPYVPFQTLPLLAQWVDQPLTHDIKLNVEFNGKNYLVTLPAADGILAGPAIRAAQLNNALATAIADDNKNLTADSGEATFNLATAGFLFQLPASAKPKWYSIEFTKLKENDVGFAERQVARLGNFIDYGTPLVITLIDTWRGWDPIADINADTTKDRITWREFRAAGAKQIFKLDVQATAVANLTMELSIGDTATNVNLAIPRVFADLNIDWSTRSARSKIEKAKQEIKDQAASGTQPADDDYGDSLRALFAEEDDTTKTPATGGDKGIDPASPLVKEIDWKPEVGFSNIRLDIGSFLTDFLKPVVDKAEPYLAEIRPVLTFLNSRVPVLSDLAGSTIRVVDLLEKFGGPKAQGVRGVIDTVTAIDNLVARIAALPAGVNVQIPMGRFWFPKVPDPDKGGYKYDSLKYDNVALGINTANYSQADRDAQAALEALAATSPDSSAQQQRQSNFSNNARDRGGIRVPILDDPGTLFQLMMGKTATLVTFQLPKLNFKFEKTIPLVRIVVFEVGLRASFEMNSNLAFGFDTYGINQYMTSGDALDIAQGFYVSDRANADGTGADVPEFQAIVSFGLYGGVDLVVAKGGVEGGLRVTAEVNLNDPNNDGKLRLTEAIGLVIDTGNPLDLFDLSLRGEVYARYYYSVGVGPFKISGGKDFARQTIFNLVHEGSDGTPLYASVVNSSDGDAQLPGTLLLHVGEAAPKRVSNQDPLKAKDGAEEYKIWNDSPGSGTVHVQYRNYSQSTTKTYSGVLRVVFEGGIGDDVLDASGLHGIPLVFDGGDGNDTVIIGSGHATTVSRVVGNDGNDTITVLGGGLFELVGGIGNDAITGGTGAVRIEAGEGNDSVTTRAGSTATIVMASDYGKDSLFLDAGALQNLIDFTAVASAIEFLLDGLLGATVDGTATAGDENVITFNVGGATEIRGSTQADSFTVRNPRTRNVTRAAAGMNGLLLRGGQGDDLYDFTLDSVGNVGSDGIVIDDVQAITPAVAGTVTLCGPCNKIESIAVSSGGLGYALPPQVVILDPTGSGAQATAVIDEQGRVTSIQIINGGSGYTNPQVMLVAPRSLTDKLVLSSIRPGATISRPAPSGRDAATMYTFGLDGKGVRWVGWGDSYRPAGFDQSEIDSVTVNLPEGVLTLASSINLFQTLTVTASRMVQNARVVADTIELTTDHGFQVRHPIHAVNSGDVKLRVTGDGTNTGEGELNAAGNRATATATVVGGSVSGLALGSAGSHYHFLPSITVGSDGVTPGTGARFAATAGSGTGLGGFTQLSGGSGYYTSPAPVVVIPPPASIQLDAMITSSLPNNYTGFGLGDGRGRVLLFADTGAVSTSGEVFFPIDTRPGMPQGSPTIDWIGGDFRYRSSVGLDDLVSSTSYPGISVGLGAEFTAVLDADGRVTNFARVSGGSGYSADLPPLVEIEGLATAVPVIASDGTIESLRVTYPGDGYGQPPRVTIRPNGFGRIVNSPNGVGSGLSADGVTPMNRVHVRALGGTLVTVAGTGVGDPLKPLKSDVEKFVAQVTTSGGVHLLEKDGLRIGKDQSVSGITTVNGDVSITTFGGALELGAPRQALDEQGRPLWQDAAKTIPIYDRDPVTNRIIYEGGDIAVGSGDVKLTADDIEVNVDLNSSGGSGTIVLQPVRVNAEIGLAGTRARVEGVVSNGRLTGFDASKFWGGRGYTTAPLVIVDPAGQRAFASAVIEAGQVIAIDVIYGGTNYDPADPPFVSIGGGGIAGALPVNQANAVAIVRDDGVITGFTITNAGSGYVTAPQVSIASPGQALVQAVLDTANPDPVTGRFAVKEFVITNQGKNYTTAPVIEVAAPYDFVLDSDEVNKFAQSFAQVVIGRIEGQHLIHSPEAVFDGAVVLRAPRAGGTLDVASFVTSGPISIVGSGNTFHFDSAAPVLTGTSISIDDNVIVHAGVSGVATATTGEIVIFGTGKGMIDGDPTGTDVGDDEDLVLAAQTTVTVTGAIGSRWKLDDLTVTSATRGAIVLGQSVGLTGDLDITGGAVTIGGVVDVAGDLVIDASSMVTFAEDVTVGGDLVITGASGVMFSGSLTVGGTITFVGVGGTVRFAELVTADDDLTITATTLVEFLGGLAAAGDVTITSNEVEFRGGMASVVGSATGTLVVKPHTAARPIRVGTPTGTTAGTLDISDTDLAALAPGWAEVVIGDAAAGTGAVTIGSIGTQQGSRNSWIGNTTTIVGGSVTVAQKVDIAATAASLKLVGRTGGVTVNAAINETAAERNAWLQLEAAQGIAINAAIWSTQTVSLVSGTTTAQTALAPITTSGLRVSAGGAVSLGSSGNAFDTLAVATTNDDILVRELSGYAIGTVDGVSGITVGTATATLVSEGQVTQTQPISAGMLDLQGAGGEWSLMAANTIGTLTADTGRVIVVDAAGLTVGSLRATKQDYPAIDLYAPGGLTLTGPITTTGGHVTLNDAVTLAADIVIDMEDAGAMGRVNFVEAVNGTTGGQESLAVLGHLYLYAAGSIGAGTALESLSVSGDSNLTAGISIRTTGDQTFSGAATSAGTVTVQAGVGSVVRFLGDVSLGGLVTATADTAAYDVRLTGSTVAITNGVTFANTGSVTLGDAATDDLHFVSGLSTAAASATNLAGTIRTTDSAATFGRTSPNAGIVLAADTTVSTGSGAALFAGTVNGAHRLVVNAAGDTTFAAAVGGTTPLSHVETDAAGRTLVNGGAITTVGPASQLFADPVLLGADTVFTAGNAAAITFGSTLDGAFTAAFNTTGTTSFNGAVGGTTPLVSLTTDAGGTTQINGGSIATTGSAGQVFNDAVTLGANTVLNAVAGAITFATTLDGPYALTANTTGTTRFDGVVGTTTPLVSLTTNAGGTTQIDGGSVATSGSSGQVFNDAVLLGANATLDAAAGAITFATTLDGSKVLAVNTTGTTRFDGAVGGTTPLVSLATNAGGTTEINGGSLRTSGPAGQVFNDAVLLGANTALDAAAGAITFATTLDGAYALTANTTGTTRFDGVVGTTTPLASVTTNAGGTTEINGGSMATTGLIFNDAVLLGANTTLDTALGAIVFATTLDGAYSLAANSAGTTQFGGAVGGTTPLVSLTTNAGGTTEINGGSIATTGVAGQVFNEAVLLGANATLDAAVGAITFAATLDGAYSLVANTILTTRFDAAVGGATPLVSLTTNAGGTTLITAGSITTTGQNGVVFGDPVILGADLVVSAGSGAIFFGGMLDGAFGLVANTTGLTTFTAAVGDNVPLASLATSAGGVSIISGGRVHTSGSQAWRDDVVSLSADTMFRSNTGAIVGGVTTIFQALGLDVDFAAGSGIGASVAPMAPAAAPIQIAAASVTGQVTGSGDINIIGVGDLVIGPAGLTAPGTISIDASQQIRVPDGGWIQGAGGVTAGKPVRWSVLLGAGDAGPGSLRQVIANANVAGVEGVVVFPGSSNVLQVGTPLPTVTTRLTLDGTGAGVVLDGGQNASGGLVFGPGSAGSTLRAVTFRRFTGAAVVLDASAGTLVQGIVVQASGTGLRATGSLPGTSVAGSTFTGHAGFGIVLDGATGLVFEGNTVVSLNTGTSMGLYATGESAGTRVIGNVFRGGLRGALLDGAKRLAFGEIGRGNRLIGSAAVRGSDFAGTGIRAQGDLAGTTIRSNVITGNNYGMAFVNARGVTFGGRRAVEANRINASRITGVLVVGANTGSANIGTVFGVGANRNRVNITRAQGSRGV